MASSTESHWERLGRYSSRLGPPTYVSERIVAAYRAAAALRAPGRALLLGATPQLSEIAEDVTAVEASAAVIAKRWPGDTRHRRAVQVDWREMQFARDSFDLCVGDGALNVLPSLQAVGALLGRIDSFLATNGRIAIRVFLTPEDCESVADVFAAAGRRSIAGFGAFKWRLIMAITAEMGATTVALHTVFRRFSDTAPDRQAFCDLTGFDPDDVDTIDAYDGSSEVYCMPTPSGLISAVPPELRFVKYHPTDGYELAERFPIAVIDVR